ncbi:MAG: DUF4139 domain-containing protein [Candidatus Riflebacteria bacterium]|nr:DUF4139 domain-containing protein [Candidatus Riflebacteria bacterium]
MKLTTLDSRIDSVTVYRQGALVSRSADLVVGDGPDRPVRIRITGLPLCLDDGTVRVRVEALEGPVPVATDVRVVYDVPGPDRSLPPPSNEELKAAVRAVALVKAQLESVERSLTGLDRLSIVARPEGREGQPPNPTPVDARLALVNLRERRLGELTEERRKLRARLDEARLVAEDLEKRSRSATTARQARENELRKAALVGLKIDQPGPARARLTIEYSVPGARWAPAYAVRFDRDLTRAAVTLRSTVRQKTGEDWAGVQLTLSTADPLAWTALPELASVRIGRRQPGPARPGWRPAPLGAGQLYEEYDRSFGPGTEPPAGPVPPPSPRAPSPSPAPPPPGAAVPEQSRMFMDAGMMAKAAGDAHRRPNRSPRPPPPWRCSTTAGCGWRRRTRRPGASCRRPRRMTWASSC